MVGAEALLVDGQRAAHQRLGLGQPVGGLQQLGQVVEAVATSGWSGPKVFSSMASARRISGSASASRLVACSNSARLLRRMATSGCSGPEALLVDGQRAAHQRLGLGQPVGGLQQLRQVVEAMATSGWSGPKLFSSMASARRISGSASASRLVALSSRPGC